MTNLSTSVKNLRYWMRNWLGSHAITYRLLSLLSYLPSYETALTTSETDICIEGFPRSANSYLEMIFRLQNPNAKCAHHLHVPMQVIRAVQLDIPCIVLIRNPVDAVASVLVADRALSIRLAVESYINFYRQIERVRDKVVVAHFDRVVAEANAVISDVNRKYGTAFNTDQSVVPDEGKVFEKLEQKNTRLNRSTALVPIPTEAKKKAKQDVLGQLLQEPTLREAEQIYQRLTMA